MAIIFEELANLVGVLVRQQRARDIDEPSAGFHGAARGRENRLLVLDPGSQNLGLQPPFGVGLSPPSPRPATRRIHEHHVGQANDPSFTRQN